MTSTPLLISPPAGYERIGDGEHSEVFRRPGSRHCIQLFRPDTELTVERINTEYAYLRQAYSALPGLIPAQRLIAHHRHVHLATTVLVKEWVGVDASRPLNRVRAGGLAPGTAAQLEQFVAATRALLARVAVEEILLPDIIDIRFRNLALDTHGRLRLLDTNQLINTRALRALAPGQTLDITRRRIHAALLRRLMYLDAAFCGRTRAQLTSDPLYTRYLSPANFQTLFRGSTAAGEPCDRHRSPHRRAQYPVPPRPRLWHDKYPQDHPPKP
ncbi:hypothetical protein [Actinacidiphila oryziradicis]|uniref:PhoP regulatory network protein YrbL n=1 Tax=Actinacidiphila oryziradicis TaxID=2571141 RepID=A0A4U0SPE8_9ACTN|nr:hypothetical protein [Actinacidiphila oryziradicis]TKA02215.1 hypothetical protein FCI23_38375 [Actinacidiphila oryziradicis]